jgi:glyoxylase-like metal-dependent hydrolase (beta-lactamase superfamily II)
MLETTGHARHHMSVLDEATGTVFAGDAVGARIRGAGLYPTLPPPDLDLEAGARSLDRLAALAATRLCLSHFGPAPDPLADIALARDQLARAGAAARAAGAGREALRGELERALPLEPAVADAGALARWDRMGWAETNVDGLEGWRERA